jgi:Yersinia/Haemophilus virulence surface antigen
MPDYNMFNGADSNSVPDRLRNLGSQIGAMNQSNFREKLAVPVGKSAVDRSVYMNKALGGGYCAGVCLDWIRRVLLSQPERDERYLTYQYENLAQGKRTFDSKGTKRSVEASALRSSQNVQVQADAYALTNSLSWYTQQGESASHLEANEFRREAARMDVFFDKARRLAKRHESERKFASLELVDSKMSVYGSASQWMNELFSSLIRPGCVSYLGFGTEGGSGHAVTAWQRKGNTDDAGSYYFFDPNFGVYSYSKTALREAIKMLFGMEAGHVPYYSTCAHATAQRLKVMIFGPARLVTATPSNPVLEEPTVTLPPPVRPVSRPEPQPSIQSTPLVSRPQVQPTQTLSASAQTVQQPAREPIRPEPTTVSSGTPFGATAMSFSLPRPGNNTAPRATTTAQTTGGTLSGQIDAALLSGTKLPKVGGQVAASWKGYESYDGWVAVDRTLTEKLKATRVVDWNDAQVKTGVKGNSIERGLLALLSARLKQANQ